MFKSNLIYNILILLVLLNISILFFDQTLQASLVEKNLLKAEKLFLQGDNEQVFEITESLLSKDSSLKKAYELTGKVYERLGKYEKAKNAYRQFLNLALEVKNDSDKSLAFNYLSLIYFKQGFFDKAIEFMLSSITIEKKIGLKDRLASRYYNLGIIYQSQGYYKKALKQYLIAKYFFNEIYEGIENTNKNLIVNGSLALLYQIMGNYSKADKLYSELSQNVDSIVGDLKNKSRIYSFIGDYKKFQKNYSKALFFYKKSLEIENKLGNQSLIALEYNNIGSIYFRQSNFKQALENFMQALQINSEINDELALAISYSNLGLLSRKLKQYVEAIEYFQNSIRIHEKYEQNIYIADGYHNLAETYRLQGENSKALVQYEKAINSYEKLFDNHRKAITHLSLAEFYYNNYDNLNASFDEYEKANDLYRRVREFSGLAYSYWWMAIIKEKQKEYLLSREYYEKAYSAYERINSKEINSLRDFIRRINTKLVKKLESENKFDEAKIAKIRYGTNEKELDMSLASKVNIQDFIGISDNENIKNELKLIDDELRLSQQSFYEKSDDLYQINKKINLESIDVESESSINSLDSLKKDIKSNFSNKKHYNFSNTIYSKSYQIKIEDLTINKYSKNKNKSSNNKIRIENNILMN